MVSILFEPNPHTNRVYVNYTLNPKRGTEEYPGAHPSNPRVQNLAGHTIEIIPPEGDHTSQIMTWDMLLLAGNSAQGAMYGYDLQTEAELACPDNAVIDPQGRLWITGSGHQECLCSPPERA